MIVDRYLDRLQFQPFEHQSLGIQKIVEEPYFGLFDDMGLGKTKQTIDAIQILFDQGKINRVIVVCPRTVRSVWFDPELGQIRSHAWGGIKHIVSEYHNRIKQWRQGPAEGKELRWIITNYEFIRAKPRLKHLMRYAGPKTMLVLDESSAVKTHSSQQTKACLQLRKLCGRVLLLNGTPYENSPGDLYSQCLVMSSSILDCATWTHFKSRYAVVQTRKFKGQQREVDLIVGWQNLDDLNRRIAPYVLRRLKSECLDLPPKLAPVPLYVPLEPSTWKVYQEMKKEAVAWLSASLASTTMVSVAKVMRLAQITSGFIGGVESLVTDDDMELTVRPSFMGQAQQRAFVDVEQAPIDGVKFISREKLDFLHDWLETRLEQNANLRVLVWFRFKPEMLRAREEITARGKFIVNSFYGGQKADERQAALYAMDRRTTPKGPQVMLATLGTGARGLDMTVFNIAVNVSNNYASGQYAQSTDRIHRPGQTETCQYFDLVAVGPKGQRTIDHTIIAVRDGRLRVADMTYAAWRAALEDEGDTGLENVFGG